MSRTRGRRRRFGATTATTVWFAAVAAVAVMVGAVGLTSVPAGALTLACGGNGNVAMVGTPTQTMVQQNLYIPQHVAACPFAQGTLSYRGSSDDAAVLAATLRTNPLMAIDVPLTVLEKGVLETDATALQGRAAGLVNQIPALLDGFSVGYNLAGCNGTQPVNLRGAVLAAIFSGAVTNWSDPTIVVDNPGLANCRLRIQVAVRNDSATSTLVFKNYLAKFLPAFVALDQPDTTVNTWPSTLSVACRGVGDPGMVSCLSISGAIGYMRYQTAAQNGISSAAMENGNRDFVLPAETPTTEEWPSNCPAAATSAQQSEQIPPRTDLDWSTVSLTDQNAGYPICTFSYELVFSRMRSAYSNSAAGNDPAMIFNVIDQVETIVDPSIQAQLPTYGFAPLPDGILSISSNGALAVSYS